MVGKGVGGGEREGVVGRWTVRWQAGWRVAREVRALLLLSTHAGSNTTVSRLGLAAAFFLGLKKSRSWEWWGF